MAEHTQDFQEFWVREAVRCLVPPSVFMVLRGDDGRFYPVRRIGVSGSSFVELVTLNGSVVSFERYADALSFCRATSTEHFSFY
jgi:hypothetical protein